MLTYLRVKDFAIIDELGIEFGEGLNVITGETGAGKSIIINALSTLTNPKNPSDMVRSNTAQAEVSAHFFAGREEYIVKRIISRAGRSRGFLNDEPVTLGRLEEMAGRLVNIYGQNEFQHLLDKESYIAIIDTMLGLTSERERLSEKVTLLKRLKAELEVKKGERSGREKEIYLLEFQIDEIEKAGIREGEEEEIRERLKLLKDGEKITSALETISDNFYESDQSIQVTLKTLMGLLKPFSAIEDVNKLKDRMESLSFEVEDIMSDVKRLEKTAAFDPRELETLEARISQIFQLKNKYGKTYDEIMSFEDSARRRLAYLSTLSENIADLSKEKERLEKEVTDLARTISDRRARGVPPIEEAIVRELGLLSIKDALFRIALSDKGNIDEEGSDEIELLISTNPGEPLKPLRRVASGGELSRIMLAMKRVIGGEKEKVLIFDEVDAGIGGRVADMVGKRLRSLAKEHQVICITHLPQIAAYGEHHYLVEKSHQGNGTKTGIRRLSKEERVPEIARMMGGASVTEKALQRAEEMLCNAEKGVA
ncbi:MAG TPA: DNA repair protein RecN [Syntrophorhabdaceae bacterium]|jgi:DNA repair protein RecN (Recombination protein N)